MPRLIALDKTVELGGVNPVHECRPTHSDKVCPADGSFLAELWRPCLSLCTTPAAGVGSMGGGECLLA
ncbi:hypothetical protein AB0M34_32715 [Nocardia sp. NPDC050193]